MFKYLAPLIIFIAIAAFLFVGLHRDPREVPSPLIGKALPAFKLDKLHRPEETLGQSKIAEKVSLLNVWASWCVACREEHPLLLKIASDAVLPVYGLNYKDERDEAIRWLARLGDPYTASAHDYEGKVGLDLGVYGVPETFLVNTDGKIVYKHIGPITPNAWEQTILPMIRELQGAVSDASR